MAKIVLYNVTNEVKEYCNHVDALIDGKQLEIKALDGLIQVCRQFDGKVLNKRYCLTY